MGCWVVDSRSRGFLGRGSLGRGLSESRVSGWRVAGLGLNRVLGFRTGVAGLRTVGVVGLAAVVSFFLCFGTVLSKRRVPLRTLMESMLDGKSDLLSCGHVGMREGCAVAASTVVTHRDARHG